MRESGGGENIGQSFCSTAFKRKGPKQGGVQQNKPSSSHSLLTSFSRHSDIILSPSTDNLTVLDLIHCRCFLVISNSHCPDNIMVRCSHSPALATVAWIQHVKNHINMSPPEGGIIASNGTGLEGKSIQSGEGREDGAGQRRGLCGFGNMQQQMSGLFFQYVVASKRIRRYHKKDAEFHPPAIMTTKQPVESQVSRTGVLQVHKGTEIRPAWTHWNNHIIIETPGQCPPHGPSLAELCVRHFRHLRKGKTENSQV